MKKFLTVIFIVTLVSSMAFGQQEETRRRSSGPRRQLATIVFAGLGGAILGLSTLSFYGRPQDELANIAIGFAVGVIAGTAYVTFKSATTRDYYDQQTRYRLFEDPSAKEIAPPVVEEELAVSDLGETSRWTYSPLIATTAQNHTALGASVSFQF
jgi:hypothetical protein